MAPLSSKKCVSEKWEKALKKYKYVAAFPNGKIIKGSFVFETSEQLKSYITEQGLILLEYNRVCLRESCKLRAIQLSEFCRELSAMLSSGVPISKAFEIIIQREQTAVMQKAFGSVYERIKQGEALSSAMEHHSGMFPELLTKMVFAGESNGSLDKTLARMSGYYDKEHRTRSEIRSAAMYPSILAVITLLVIIVIFAFIFPIFSELLAGMELPAITVFMLGVSRLFTEHFYILIISVAVLIIFIWWIRGIDKVRTFFDRTILKLPVTGRLVKIICTARFARTFSSLYSGGLPVLTSLEISSSTIRNRYIEAQFIDVINSVRSGEPLSKALAAVDGFDGKLIAALAIGEESGKIDELLLGISDSYDFEASAAIKKIVKLIEPMMIFVMAAIILIVVLSVMLPIYDMYSNLGNSSI